MRDFFGCEKMEQAEQNTCDFCFKKANWIVHGKWRGENTSAAICSGVSPCHTKAVETCGFYYFVSKHQIN